jgi:hypothetical protein
LIVFRSRQVADGEVLTSSGINERRVASSSCAGVSSESAGTASGRSSTAVSLPEEQTAVGEGVPEVDSRWRSAEEDEAGREAEGRGGRVGGGGEGVREVGVFGAVRVGRMGGLVCFLFLCRLDFLAAWTLPLSGVSSGSDREKVLVTTG